MLSHKNRLRQRQMVPILFYLWEDFFDLGQAPLFSLSSLPKLPLLSHTIRLLGSCGFSTLSRVLHSSLVNKRSRGGERVFVSQGNATPVALGLGYNVLLRRNRFETWFVWAFWGLESFSGQMSCFSCISPRQKEANNLKYATGKPRSAAESFSENGRRRRASFDASEQTRGKGSFDSEDKSTGGQKSRAASSFTFRELATATRNFKLTNLIGEGGFGRVYKGRLETGQVVAIKQLNREGLQGNQEFIVEVLMLSLLHHSNLVNLIGYCAEGDQRLLVYEYMAMGSLENHIFDLSPDKKPLGWNERIKIAAGAAQGLEYLHVKANPPVIYRDLKSANILLDSDFNPKLSDFGLAKLGPVGDNTHVSTRVMGTYGYCAPEYAMSGKLTLKSDVYSFGVVLLELITGKKAYDTTRAAGEHNLVNWSRPFFRDKRKFVQIVDPLLEGRFPLKCFHHAIAITAMCLQEQPHFRPLISDVVVALEYLASQPYTEGNNNGKLSPLPPLPPSNAIGDRTSSASA